MKFRPHRGSLADALAEAVEVDGRAGLLARIRKNFEDFGPEFTDEQITVEPYGGDDDRVGWKNVHIVFLPGYGVIGFCEGPAV